MAYPWRQPVRLPQMLAAPDPGPSTGGAGRELFARSARIRRRQLVAHVQEAGEARHALVRQAVVAVGDHAADRRWRGALGVGEARADAEAQAVRAFDNQRAEHAAVLALAPRVPDHARLGVVVGLVLEQVAAAADAVARVLVLQHQSFAACGDHRLQQCVEFGGVARSEEHTSELQSLMRISYAVFCLKKKTYKQQ